MTAVVCKHGQFIPGCSRCTTGREQTAAAVQVEQEWIDATARLQRAFTADLVVTVALQDQPWGTSAMSAVAMATQASREARQMAATVLRELAAELDKL